MLVIKMRSKKWSKEAILDWIYQKMGMNGKNMAKSSLEALENSGTSLYLLINQAFNLHFMSSILNKCLYCVKLHVSCSLYEVNLQMLTRIYSYIYERQRVTHWCDTNLILVSKYFSIKFNGLTNDWSLYILVCLWRSYFKCQKANCMARKKAEWCPSEPGNVRIVYENPHSHGSNNPTGASGSSQSSNNANQYNLLNQVLGNQSFTSQRSSGSGSWSEFK